MAATNEPPAEKASQSTPIGKPTIVALGASAGGLEALNEFFEHVPPDSGLTYVVITHQHPGHTSLLPDLVAKHTQMKVTEAKDGDRLVPNRVFIAPPEGQLAVFNCQLQVMKPLTAESLHLPIDSFFRSLAIDQHKRAICVVLSGTGSDGTLGLKAIKAEAGMVMVQDPTSAKYPGMPQSAIATGLADYIQPTTSMAAQLMAYVNGPYLGPHPSSADSLAKALPRVFLLLRNCTGHDFSSYKTSTLRRRIERRMNVQQIASPDLYVDFLRQHPHEVGELFKELLISVTNFFRDPDAFEALADAFSQLVAAKPDHSPVRAWVTGCATGEEAYSVAIVIHECLAKLEKGHQVQVFGTDLDAAAIETARLGRYPEGIANDVGTARLRRFFYREDNAYRIKKEIRDMVVFAPQDIIKDPPFTKLDLLSCRNLLIYLNADLQKQLLPILQYALNPGGLLLLGPSESVGGADDLFGLVNKKWKLYRRNETITAQPPDFPLTRMDAHGGEKPPAVKPRLPARRAVNELLQEHLMIAYIPPTVIVDSRGEIIHVQGKTGLYLELPSGHVSTNLIEMARVDLQLDLAAALRQASTHDKPVVHKGIKLKSNGDIRQVNVTVRKINAPEPIRGMLMVTFEPSPPTPAGTKRAFAKSRDSGRAKQLEHELQYMKETLQATVEEYETGNEELKSTNEELQSTNEELQSANEELETSHEEMQSLNEELQTVNAELMSKVEELSQANDDMQNLINSTEIATLFLDNELNIKRFTKSATKLFKVRDVDVGRHLGEIVSTLDYGNLADDARGVLHNLVFREKEVVTEDDTQCYRMRIMPYRTSNNVIDGVVVTFVDMNEIREARDFAQNIINTVSESLLVLDNDLRVVSANPAFYRLFAVTPQDVESRLIFDLGKGQWDSPQLREVLEKVLPENSMFEDHEVVNEFPKIGRKRMVVSGRRLEQKTHRPGLILLAIRESQVNT